MITSKKFFALVERHLTVPMREVQYPKIGEYDGLRASPTSGLLSSDVGWIRRSRLPSCFRKRGGGPRVPALEVGYEASFADEEKWIRYYPETHELDLISWRDTLDGHANWDVWHDRLVPDEDELERRLMVLGSAVRAGRAADPRDG